MGTWKEKGSTASTNVSKNEQNVTFNVRSLGGTKNQNIETLQVGTNLDVSSNVDWISNIVIQQHNASDKYYDVKFKVAQNNVTSSRSGKITFTYNEQEAYLNVVQAAGDVPVTSFKIYLTTSNNTGSNTNFSSCFSYMRINGGNLIDLNDNAYINLKNVEIYNSQNNNTVTVEVQPNNNLTAGYLQFNHSTSHGSDIIDFDNGTHIFFPQVYVQQDDPVYWAAFGQNGISWGSTRTAVKIHTNDNAQYWTDCTVDVSVNIPTESYTKDNKTYPVINIYISNKLKPKQVNPEQQLEQFAIWIVNESPGGNRKFGDHFTLTRKNISPNTVNFPTDGIPLQISENMDKRNIHIDIKYKKNNEEYLKQAFEDKDLTGSYYFYIAPVGTNTITTASEDYKLKILPSPQFTGLDLVKYKDKSLQLNIRNGNLEPVFTSGEAYQGGDSITVYGAETIQINCSCEYYGIPEDTTFTLNYSGNSGN